MGRYPGCGGVIGRSEWIWNRWIYKRINGG
jgi:hypothetical protein